MKHFITILISLTLAMLMPAQAQTAHRYSNSRPVGVNLSLWRGVSTQRTDTVGSTLLNIGLFSSQNRLNGLGVNILGGVVGRDVNGVQVAGFFNMAGGSMRGIQAAGITNINGNNLTGISASGLFGITGRNARGIIVSGLANIAGDNLRGVAAAGLLNVNGGKSAGVQLSGLANINGGQFRGIMLSGLMNVAGDTLRGIQTAALLNVAAGEMRGIQAGAMNVAVYAKGLQIGLVNFYSDRLDGIQIGLINANPETRIDFMANAGSSSLLDLGFRFRNRRTYTILALGSKYYKLDKMSYTATYRAGLWLPLTSNLSASGDLGFQHIETFHNGRNGQPARLYALQARLSAELAMDDRFSLFLTGGYDHSRDYHGHKFHNGLFFEAGTFIRLGTFGGQQVLQQRMKGK